MNAFFAEELRDITMPRSEVKDISLPKPKMPHRLRRIIYEIDRVG